MGRVRDLAAHGIWAICPQAAPMRAFFFFCLFVAAFAQSAWDHWTAEMPLGSQSGTSVQSLRCEQKAVERSLGIEPPCARIPVDCDLVNSLSTRTPAAYWPRRFKV